MGQSREISQVGSRRLVTLFGILVATAAVPTATPVAAQPRILTASPPTLNNPYGWPCPAGYTAVNPTLCRRRLVRLPPQSNRLAEAEAARSATDWINELDKRKQIDQEARQEAARRAQEVEQERLQAREAEVEARRAEARKRYAEDRQRAAEARRKAAEAAVQENRHATEARRKAIEAAAKAKRLADEEDRRAAEAEQRAAEAESRAAKIERAKREAEVREQQAKAHERQRQLEADARARQRLGIFGEQELSDIINAADHNTVRFEKNYKGKTFSAVGLFDEAGKANLGIGNDLAVHINVRNGRIVCFINKSKADVVGDWHAGTRVKFTGTISSTALLGGTLQLQNCTMTAG